MFDALASFHFQLFQLICFLLLLLYMFIFPHSLATAFSALIPLLLPSQGLSDLSCCNFLHNFLYHLQKPYPYILAPCLVWGAPAQAPDTSCSATPLPTAQMDGRACAHHAPLRSPKPPRHLARKSLGYRNLLMWRDPVCLLAQAAPPGLHKAEVKRGLEPREKRKQFTPDKILPGDQNSPERSWSQVWVSVFVRAFFLLCVARSKMSCLCSTGTPFIGPAMPLPTFVVSLANS